MKIILLVIPVVSFIFALINGNMSEVSGSVMDKSGEAVQLVISLCGMMCFWCGLMKVAERSGLTEKLAAIISPVLGILFRKVQKNSKAMGLISMNIAANILGLGNATTPLGVAAMKAIAEEQPYEGDAACDDMIMLAVLNTASLQILPVTTAALRSANGVYNPLDILPSVWVVSAYSVIVAVVSAKLMGKLSKKFHRRSL